MDNRVLLVVMPLFGSENKILPYPAFGYITASLKNSGYDPVMLDFRLMDGSKVVLSPEFLPVVTARNLYLYDIYELPLLISMAENFAKGDSPEPDCQVISSWALERDFLPERVQRVLSSTQDFVHENLNLFENSGTVVFALDYSNLYISAFTALKLKKQRPGIKIIFTGPQLERSENLASFLMVSGVADAVVTGPEQLIKLISGKNITDTIFPDYGDLTAYKLIPVEPGHHTPDAVVQELSYLRNFYRRDNFFLGENLCYKSTEWLNEFSCLMSEKNEKIRWSAFLPEITSSLAFKLKKAGLVQAFLKLTTQADFTVSVNSLVENGIFTSLNLVAASPGETDTTFYKTVNEVGALLNSLAKADKLNFFRFTPTPFQPVSDFTDIRSRSWQEYEKSFIFPDKYTEIAANTPCTYQIENIPSTEVLYRLFLLKQTINNYG